MNDDKWGTPISGNLHLVRKDGNAPTLGRWHDFHIFLLCSISTASASDFPSTPRFVYLLVSPIVSAWFWFVVIHERLFAVLLWYDQDYEQTGITLKFWTCWKEIEVKSTETQMVVTISTKQIVDNLMCSQFSAHLVLLLLQDQEWDLSSTGADVWGGLSTGLQSFSL